MEKQIAPVAYAAKEVLGSERGMVTRAYAALIAVELRIGAYSERGRAVKLADELAVEFARLRAGDKAWNAQDETGRAASVRACASSAKRYADKAVGIAKQAQTKGAPMLEILNAASDADAQALVKGWLVSLKCVSMDTLFETFGYAKPTAEKKAKADKTAPSAGTTEKPAQEQPQEQPKQAPDNAQKVGKVEDFVAITRAVMANWSEAERLEYAQAMLPELLALARNVPALTA
jgi:hypothetical protein